MFLYAEFLQLMLNPFNKKNHFKCKNNHLHTDNIEAYKICKHVHFMQDFALLIFGFQKNFND